MQLFLGNLEFKVANTFYISKRRYLKETHKMLVKDKLESMNVPILLRPTHRTIPKRKIM